jgi:hypothetical protein
VAPIHPAGFSTSKKDPNVAVKVKADTHAVRAPELERAPPAATD